MLLIQVGICVMRSRNKYEVGKMNSLFSLHRLFVEAAAVAKISHHSSKRRQAICSVLVFGPRAGPLRVCVQEAPGQGILRCAPQAVPGFKASAAAGIAK